MIRRRKAGALDELDGDRVDLRRRTHAGAVGLDLSVADRVRDGLGHHAARGIALRQEENPQSLALHDALQNASRSGIRDFITSPRSARRGDACDACRMTQ
jgi:hypothetical protein